MKLATAEASAGSLTLDRSHTTSYEPRLTLDYPNTWHVYEGLIMDVVEPRHVVVSNRPLDPLGDVDGLPDMTEAPSDAAVLVIYSEYLLPNRDTSAAHRLSDGVQFGSLAEGLHDDTPGVGRRFFAWFADGSASHTFYLFRGDEEPSDWATMEDVVSSVRGAL